MDKKYINTGVLGQIRGVKSGVDTAGKSVLQLNPQPLPPDKVDKKYINTGVFKPIKKERKQIRGWQQQLKSQSKSQNWASSAGSKGAVKPVKPVNKQARCLCTA